MDRAIQGVEARDKEIQDHFIKLPDLPVLHAFKHMSSDNLMRMRNVCERWNQLACFILENYRDVHFVDFHHLNTFVDWINSQNISGLIIRFKTFHLDIADLIGTVVHQSVVVGVGHIVHGRFAAISQAVTRFNLHLGSFVRVWICNLQIGTPQDIPISEICEELLLHLMTYFSGLEELELQVPLINLNFMKKDMLAFIQVAPILTRRNLRVLHLNFDRYSGASQASSHYLRMLESSMMSLLSVTTNLRILKVTEGYNLLTNFIICPVLKHSAQFASTLKTLVITPAITLDQLNALTAARFRNLQTVEICIYPGENEKISINNFLITCSSNLISLAVWFKRTNTELEQEPSNDMKIFPSRDSGYSLPRLVSLTLGGYVDGIVRLHMMPLLQRLCITKSKNLIFVSNDNKFIPNRLLADFASNNELRHRLEDIEFSRYVHNSSFDHAFLKLLSPKIKILQVTATNFCMPGIFQHICRTCTMLEYFGIVNCYDMDISDNVLCAGPRDPIPDKFVHDLQENNNDELQIEELRSRASRFDTSAKEPGQLSNLKRLKGLYISSSIHENGNLRAPISDVSIFYGVVHCHKLEDIRFDFKSHLSSKGRLMIQLMLPHVDPLGIRFE